MSFLKSCFSHQFWIFFLINLKFFKTKLKRTLCYYEILQRDASIIASLKTVCVPALSIRLCLKGIIIPSARSDNQQVI